MSLDFSDLETDPADLPVRATAKQITFPCSSCHGTGKWVGGYVNRATGKCHSCNGRGHFMTSPEYRAKNKASRAKTAQKKKDKIADAAAVVIKANKELFDYLVDVCAWNGFAKSMLESLTKYGNLSEKQMAASYRMFEKHKAKAAGVKLETDSKPTIDLARVLELFATAQGNGIAKPKLRVGVELQLAPVTGVNAGFIYVKDTDASYAGKISPDGKFFPISTARTEIEAELLAIAKDPMERAIAYGQRTGKCSCCGRQLTNKLSIELGIGPICRENWGL